MIDLENNSDIINRLKSGKLETFELVYKHYFPPLYAFASNYVEDDNAEDSVQETMLWLWENTANLIPEMSLKSLLFTIVKNKCLNKIKRNSNRSEIYQSIARNAEDHFDDPDFYLEKELMKLYTAAIQKMSPAFREAFEMSRMEGLTHKEIADVLDVSPQTVNYRIGKAMEFLRMELKDYLPLIAYLLFTK